MPVIGGARINVGFVAPCLREGGGEHWMRDLIDAVDANPGSYRVNWQGVAVLDDQANASNNMHWDMLNKVGFVDYTEGALYRLAYVCDVLISWAVYPFHSMLAIMAKPPPIIFVSHRADEPWSTTTQNWLAFVSAVVCVNAITRANVPPQFASITQGIRNYVNINHFLTTSTKASMLTGWGIPAGAAKIVGYLGRLDPERRPLLMAEVAKLIPANWFVVVAGEGSLSGQLTQAITAPGSQGNLVIPGESTNVGSFFNGIDWLVNPTSHESFGKSLGEAWWQGIPTISTPYGLAAEQPAYTRTLPVNPTAADIHAALMADFNDATGTADRATAAQSYAQMALVPSGCGIPWSALLDKFHPV